MRVRANRLTVLGAGAPLGTCIDSRLAQNTGSDSSHTCPSGQDSQGLESFIHVSQLLCAHMKFWAAKGNLKTRMAPPFEHFAEH